ncbi:MBL fold metallo-hydrolase [Bacteroidota bacterium]
MYLKISFLLCFLLYSVNSFSQETGNFIYEKVSGNVYCIYGQGGNIGALSTDDGILVVDSQFENVADSVLNVIKSISSHKIKYLINTHYHADHTSGNKILGENAEIIMHPSCKSTKQKLNELAEVKEKYLNRVSLWTEGMIINLGDESIQLLHLGNAHTSGDLIVVFENAKVIHTGDLFFHGLPPYIDVENGSDTENWIRTVNTICERYPDYKIIPGHGKITDVKSYYDFGNYLKTLREKVITAIKAGLTREETVNSIKIEEYSHLNDPGKSEWLSIENNIGWVYDEIVKQEQ